MRFRTQSQFQMIEMILMKEMTMIKMAVATEEEEEVTDPPPKRRY